eukprot:129396_1
MSLMNLESSDSDDDDDLDQQGLDDKLRNLLADDDTQLTTSQLHNQIINARVATQNEQNVQKDTQDNRWLEEINDYSVKMYEKNAKGFGLVQSTVAKMIVDKDGDQQLSNSDDEDFEQTNDIIASSVFVQAFSLDKWIDFLDPLKILQDLNLKFEDILILHIFGSETKKHLVQNYWAEIGSLMLDYHAEMNSEDDADNDISVENEEKMANSIKNASEPDQVLFDQFLTLFLPDDAAQAFITQACITAHQNNRFKIISLTDLQNVVENIMKTFMFEYFSWFYGLYLIFSRHIEKYQYIDKDKDFSDQRFRSYLELALVRTPMITKWLGITKKLFGIDGFPRDWGKTDHVDKVNKVNLIVGSMITLLDPVMQDKMQDFNQWKLMDQ